MFVKKSGHDILCKFPESQQPMYKLLIYGSRICFLFSVATDVLCCICILPCFDGYQWFRLTLIDYMTRGTSNIKQCAYYQRLQFASWGHCLLNETYISQIIATFRTSLHIVDVVEIGEGSSLPPAFFRPPFDRWKLILSIKIFVSWYTLLWNFPLWMSSSFEYSGVYRVHNQNR